MVVLLKWDEQVEEFIHIYFVKMKSTVKEEGNFLIIEGSISAKTLIFTIANELFVRK